MYYAYFLENENISDIVDTWSECQSITKGKKSRFKKFNTIEEAKKWIEDGALYIPKTKDTSSLILDAIYFDSGTGRKKIVEVKVCDVYGDTLLPFIMPEEKINSYGNYYLSENRTNNFGELTALFLALKYALKFNIKKICGDSKLVIDYWSNNKYNKEKIDSETIDLINRVVKLRKQFEDSSGEILHISGDINPADLGFHK